MDFNDQGVVALAGEGGDGRVWPRLTPATSRGPQLGLQFGTNSPSSPTLLVFALFRAQSPRIPVVVLVLAPS